LPDIADDGDETLADIGSNIMARKRLRVFEGITHLEEVLSPGLSISLHKCPSH
jgi:hypothetical protein